MQLVVLLSDELTPVKTGTAATWSLAAGCDFSPEGRVLIEKSFFFIHVLEGKASVSGVYGTCTVCEGDLIVLTPSMTSELHALTSVFRITCVQMLPRLFDSLPGGQLLYSQLTGFIGEKALPVVRLDERQADVLGKTCSLFAGQEVFRLYRNGMVRHLCELLLLQLADVFSCSNRSDLSYVKRSHELFRLFRKLLLDNYRVQHGIRFYADSLHISTTYLSRIVKGITGNTVHFLWSELVCADARKLLESTDMSVKEIADVLGFSDQSVFGKFFVTQTGISPLKFRVGQRQTERH